ncbi:MAG: hypothetical protein H0S85_09430 [Desulfovibrionaceae bacterium]|jgi:hypothetical protein|nr:hypothetical protein [Desulfovibrionaceae bacterium]
MPQPRTAIVLASYMTGEAYLRYWQRLLRLFGDEFPEADLFVGVNPCPLAEPWLAALDASGLAVRSAVTPAGKVVASDASAYQTALRLLRDSGGRYDLVWFAHTKGATSNAVDALSANVIELFLNKEGVIRLFAEEPRCGLFAAAGVVLPKPRTLVDRYRSFRYPPLALSPIFTCYAVRGAPLHAFLDGCDVSFFDARIPGTHFFEFDFPQAVFRQGYAPVVRKVVQCEVGDLAKVVSTEKTYAAVLGEWLRRCKLA